jgi:hypothetical protein
MTSWPRADGIILKQALGPPSSRRPSGTGPRMPETREPAISMRFVSIIAIPLAFAFLGPVESLRAQGVEFIRADSNDDGRIDISDPVATLNCLFAGGLCHPCPDAPDANDDAKLDISDGVFTLNHLFLGGPGPSPRRPTRPPASTGPRAIPGPAAILPSGSRATSSSAKSTTIRSSTRTRSSSSSTTGRVGPSTSRGGGSRRGSISCSAP